MEETTKKKVEGTWLKVFCPNARCLSEEEIMELPIEKRKKAQPEGRSGLWLEVFCPDETCLTAEETISLPRLDEKSKKGGRGTWLNLFCPEDRCVITKSTDLP